MQVVLKPLLLVICCFFAAGISRAQSDQPTLDDTDTRAIMMANFLFHFSAFNDWPEETKNGPFVIGIYGNDRLAQELLAKYSLKPIGGQVLEIQSWPAGAPPPREYVQVLYVEGWGLASRAVLDSAAGAPTLVVTQAEGALDSGATINFIAVDNRIRYELNAEEAAGRGLLIGNRIASWAISRN